MDIKINYHAEISKSRGKTYLNPARPADLKMLKRIDFRAGGALFAATCKALQKEVHFEVSASTLSTLDPFGFLIGDIGLPSQPGKAASKNKKVIRVCVDIECKCRGYNCKCTGRVYPC